MLTSYNIYWVDDKMPDLLDTQTVKKIEDYLVEKCYIPEINAVDYHDSTKPLNKYDLIITDFNITDGQEGYQILKNLRDNHHMTEALIYSSDPNHLEEALREGLLDRLSRISIEDDDGSYRGLVEKIKELIKISISKMEDVNILRGLVMAEFSDIHSLLLDKMSNIQERDIRDKIEKYAHKKYSKSLRGRNNKLSTEFSENKIPIDRLSDSTFDANLIGYLFHKYLFCLGFEHEEFLVEYEDVLNTRNELGHCKNIDVNRLQTADGERKFDAEECYNLRRKIIQIRGKIEKVE